MPWNIELTDEAADWYVGLNRRDQLKIGTAIDSLEERGPTLGRPHVDSIKGSRHHNMKELRSVGGHLRALFCFDPVRNAIVLIGRRQDRRLDRVVRAHDPSCRRSLGRLPGRTAIRRSTAR